MLDVRFQLSAFHLFRGPPSTINPQLLCSGNRLLLQRAATATLWDREAGTRVSKVRTPAWAASRIWSFPKKKVSESSRHNGAGLRTAFGEPARISRSLARASGNSENLRLHDTWQSHFFLLPSSNACPSKPQNLRTRRARQRRAGLLCSGVVVSGGVEGAGCAGVGAGAGIRLASLGC
jgi:hypothetical protein